MILLYHDLFRIITQAFYRQFHFSSEAAYTCILLQYHSLSFLLLSSNVRDGYLRFNIDHYHHHHIDIATSWRQQARGTRPGARGDTAWIFALISSIFSRHFCWCQRQRSGNRRHHAAGPRADTRPPTARRLPLLSMASRRQQAAGARAMYARHRQPTFITGVRRLPSHAHIYRFLKKHHQYHYHRRYYYISYSKRVLVGTGQS